MLVGLLYRNHFSVFNLFRNFYIRRVPTNHLLVSLCATTTPRPDIFWWNSSIMDCFRNREVEKACQLFEEMPHRNLVTWNCMITGYMQSGRMVDAQRVFDSMPQRNVVSWTALMTGYLQSGQVEKARHLFDKIPERNIVCWNSMISGYINNGLIEKARKLFDEMPSRNKASWSIMVSGYIRQKQLDDAMSLFNGSPFRPTSLCNALLSGYVQLGCIKEAEDLFAMMDTKDAISWNSMITCYSQARKMEHARKIFDEMPEKDVISWTAIIHGYLQNGNVKHASCLFGEMPNRDVMSWNTMMNGLMQNDMFDDALILFSKMPSRDIVSWNTILQGYVQKNDMFNARRWFESMPQRSETSWNTLISGYQNEESLAIFCDMMKEGFKPDQVTLAVILSICASLVALGWGRMIHLFVVRTGFEHDKLVNSSLICMYSGSGLVEDSKQVFDGMSNRDTIAWNAMIAAHAHHGFAKEALELYKAMVKGGFHPDHVTFLNLLLACCHKGLIYDGCQLFITMQQEWKLVPKAEHFSVVVDLLGRSGFVDQAYKFTEKLPIDLQTNAWETLLSSCRVHENLELGELAAKRVFTGEHFDGGTHVLLSNIYATKGKWSEASQLRSLMKEHGLKKETACSWIEVKGSIFSFVSNDKSNPEVERLCREFNRLYVMLEQTSWFNWL
ncbi:hypothetical protein HPP92_003096 [Vanilla planifolia]|uniref:Chlororespiratory reduction 4 n=2 Tax=Vanilla planifolia TaxID=51239 RepID=A0A835S7H4_VANPL|nr:hypothetical protein HPP92_003096 [Vanilla planifolia]